MLALRDAFSVDVFLETGTHLGRTAAWAAEQFSEVVTIEASEEFRQEAVERHGHLSNVRWVHGDTRTVLPREVEALGGAAIVWLDSHWSGGSTYGEDAECPLLFEIETVLASSHAHHLFIDDARYFVAPPPHPHEADHWPTLVQVVTALTSRDPTRDVLLFEDTFVAVPTDATALVRRLVQDAATDALKRRHEPADGRLAALRRRWLGRDA